MNLWKSYESIFPMLSKIARDLQTLPMSIVASESNFSIAANII